MHWCLCLPGFSPLVENMGVSLIRDSKRRVICMYLYLMGWWPTHGVFFSCSWRALWTEIRSKWLNNTISRLQSDKIPEAVKNNPTLSAIEEHLFIPGPTKDFNVELLPCWNLSYKNVWKVYFAKQHSCDTHCSSIPCVWVRKISYSESDFADLHWPELGSRWGWAKRCLTFLSSTPDPAHNQECVSECVFIYVGPTVPPSLHFGVICAVQVRFSPRWAMTAETVLCGV